MKYDVLVVEDETSLLRMIVQGLEGDSSLRPVGASTLGQAMAVLDDDPPDLLLTDLCLNGESGLDLIHELDRRGLRIPVIVMTGYREAYGDQLALHPELTVLEKPMPIAEMQRHVQDSLTRQGPHGEDPFTLTDYLQLAALAGGSLKFEIELASGRQGRLEVVDGELWNAWADGLTGEDALHRLMESRSRSLGLSRMEEPPGYRQLAGMTTVGFLLELAKAEDEVAKDRGSAITTDEERQEPASSFEPGGILRPGSVSFALHLRLDDASSAACHGVQEDIETGTCGLVDVAASALVGVSPATLDRPELLDGAGAGPLRLFHRALGREQGSSEVPPTDTLDEVFLASRKQFRFFKQVPGKPLVIALLTGRATRQGVAWMALRRALPSFQELVLGGEDQETCEHEPVEPIRQQLDDSATRACQRLANNIAGARGCGLLDLSTSTVVGLSNLGSSDLLDDITTRAVSLFRPSTGSDGSPYDDPLDEIFASSGTKLLFLKRVPATRRLVAVTTETTITAAVTWMTIRDALPELAALSITGLSAVSDTVN